MGASVWSSFTDMQKSSDGSSENRATVVTQRSSDDKVTYHEVITTLQCLVTCLWLYDLHLNIRLKTQFDSVPAMQ